RPGGVPPRAALPPPAPLRARPRPARGAEGLRPPDRGARPARGARARPRARRRRGGTPPARGAGACPRARRARALPRCDRPADDARPPAQRRRGRLPVPLRGTAARVPRGARRRAAGGRGGGERHPGADSRGRDRLPGTARGPGGARGRARPRRRGPRGGRPPRGARPGAGRAAPPVARGRPGLPRALRRGGRRATGRGGSMSRRVLVIGLDGATFRTLGPWAARGEMPELARLMAAGCHGELRSTFPPLTPPAWSSFMTGKNPGKHGVFSFRRLGQQRLQVTLRLLREQPWDLLSVVFYEPDRVQHFFWSHLAAAGPAGVAPEVVAEIAAAARVIFRDLDTALGELVRAAGPEAVTFVVSDHGFGDAPERFVYVNRWLAEQGFLHARRSWRWRRRIVRRLPARLRARYDTLENVFVDWSRSQAWCEVMETRSAGVWLNVRGRQPEGRVAPGAEYEGVREAI